MIRRQLSSAILALSSLVATTLVPQMATAEDFECKPAPQPILTLAYGSRYSDVGSGSKTLDKNASSDVDNALEPVDEFLRELTMMANMVHQADGNASEIADCAIGQIASWAEANALADLQQNARLTIGSRLAGIGFALLQTVPYSSSKKHMPIISRWLQERMMDQMVYWEADAPDGASRGNLRAWAGLAGATIGTVIDDPVIRGWSAWSSTYVMCTANEDGSLPQEMTRGKFALHYQLHAVAPLTVSAALLSRQGMELNERCENALQRIVNFTVDDLRSRGAKTQAITGERQTVFEGDAEVKGWQLAWLEAYLSIQFDAGLIALADEYRPLSYSKLGGDQTLIWSEMRW